MMRQVGILGMSGTGIKLNINPDDADLRTYGLRNTKAEAPFIAPASDKIPVSFDVPFSVVRKPMKEFKHGS